MRQNKYQNGYRTDNLKYYYYGYIDGIEIGEVYNNRITGFVYSFPLKYSTKKEAFRYSMTILKNNNLFKRLKYA